MLPNLKRAASHAASRSSLDSSFGLLAAPAAAASVLLLAATAAAAAPTEARTDTSWVEVTADSPPAVRLAFHDIRSLRVPEVVVERYSRLLQSLSTTCRTGEATVARVADAAVQWLNERVDRRFERIGFLSEFDESLGTARKSVPDCRTQARSVLLGMAEETDLREMEVRTLQNMLRSGFFSGLGPG